MIEGSYKYLSAKALCHRVIQLHSKKGLPEFAKLCKIGLCMAVRSVECERSFSIQNKLKNKFRSSFKDENLDALIAIKMCEIPVVSYDPRRAAQLWISKKKRRKKYFKMSTSQEQRRLRKCKTDIQRYK